MHPQLDEAAGVFQPGVDHYREAATACASLLWAMSRCLTQDAAAAPTIQQAGVSLEQQPSLSLCTEAGTQLMSQLLWLFLGAQQPAVDGADVRAGALLAAYMRPREAMQVATAVCDLHDCDMLVVAANMTGMQRTAGVRQQGLGGGEAANIGMMIPLHGVLALQAALESTAASLETGGQHVLARLLARLEEMVAKR
jgi:hypothetical protein